MNLKARPLRHSLERVGTGFGAFIHRLSWRSGVLRATGIYMYYGPLGYILRTRPSRGRCEIWAVTGGNLADAFLPGLGQAVYYRVSGAYLSGAVGGLGWNSTATHRPNDHPCP
jgi:hypothetical protein